MSSPPQRLRFLIDTNIFIAAEPTSGGDVEPLMPQVAELMRRITETGHVSEVHPDGLLDIQRDRDAERRRLRQVQHRKYPPLPSPPPIPDAWKATTAWSEGDNDHVDLKHLAALHAHAASFLVTEDRKLHRVAARLGLGERVVTVHSGLELLRTLHEQPPQPPPTVQRVLAHTLDATDPIFDSLRAVYEDFDPWFDKVRQERRVGFVIHAGDGRLAAIGLVKLEPDGNDAHLPGRVMKISTFKVAEDAAGSRRGELLLKAIFIEAAEQRVDGLYLTVFAQHHEALVATVTQFGFELASHRTGIGEHIFVKRTEMYADDLETKLWPADPLEYHVTFGPPALHPAHGEIYLVPITPSFVSRLFPDAADQPQLLEPAPYGNALRKAYLSRSATRTVEVGDVLAFYESAAGRSGPARGIIAVGVVERVIVSRDTAAVAEGVGTRTVYSMAEIREMAQAGEILALIFRQDRLIRPPVALAELEAHGALNSHPQSTTKARQEGARWLRDRLRR